MQDFTITGVLGADKTLTLSHSVAVSQGEHMTTKLKIEIPNEYSTDNFMLQFMCPNNFCYSTPLLAVVAEEDKHFVVYPLESYVLRYAGTINVQLEVRSVTDNAVLWKSVIGQDSVIQVVPSADMRSQTYARQDFFANAYATIDAMKQNEQDLNALEQDVDAVSKRCDDFLQAYEQKLSSGQLTGPQGATITSMVETGKDVEGNSIYTVSMSDGQQFQFVVKAGRQGEKGDKGDKGDTGLTGEYITDVTLYETLSNGDNKYKITTNLGNFYYFVAPKGTAGETLKALNLTSTDEQGNHTYTFVTNAGNNFNFVVPKGDKGEKGDQGDKGEKGDTPSMDGTYQGLTAGKALADGNGNQFGTHYAALTDVVNDNILINGNFAINQRAQSSYTGYKKYTADCWNIQDGSTVVNILSNGIRATNSSASSGQSMFMQAVEQDLTDKTVSLSANIDGTVFKLENIVNSGSLNIEGKSIRMFFEKQSSTGNFRVVFATTENKATDFTVYWVKLEYGRYCTQYIAPDYATELARCQRYYINYPYTFQFHGSNSATSGIVYGGIFLPSSMSDLPACVVNDTGTRYVRYADGSRKKITSMRVNSYKGNWLYMEISLEDTSNWTQYAICMIEAYNVAFDISLEV